ncbi:DUF4249 domain-containing protein [Xanthocytophaga flava]|uniref:DUF4249 domain-containing protein n=1 Tax=Xanthocytophaga flava TaxID=3048013 RepID=UPI0028D2F616|nr:DUF4249 domain-containing protein [Xanthocytophaga flavus]MDJ1472616.1 DUF4249 domain-containing protein [Xanthocytophaga flavus]
MKRYILPVLILLSVMLTSCEDVIDVDLKQGETLLVVDGWVTNQPGPYKVRLTSTAPYFTNQETPKVTGATLIISDSEGVTDTLKESEPGIYLTQHLQGKVGNTYTLKILSNGEEYMAQTEIKRVPPIDSLTVKYHEESAFYEESGYYIYYNGPEPVGIGDFYRFKIYQNDTLLSGPGDLTFAEDKLVDGNYIGDLQMNDDKAFRKGDTIRGENWAITEDNYRYYVELSAQINNGGLFSNPPANVRTNIHNNNSKGKKAVGWFGGAGVSSKEIVIQ